MPDFPLDPYSMQEPQTDFEVMEEPHPETLEARDNDQLSAWAQSLNIAETLDEQTLTAIGHRVVMEYEIDEQSLKEWRQRNEVVLKLACQIYEERTWAGERISDTKYPVLSTAAIQFASRAYANIVKDDRVVKAKIVGRDPMGTKAARGERLSLHMSAQILDEMQGWEEDTDQLLTTLPLVGVGWRKTYWDGLNNQAVSESVNPADFVVNYHARGLEPRATQIIELTPNEIYERVQGGLFLEHEYGEPQADKDNPMAAEDDREAPHIFLEQHRWWDLDDDGYSEPYVVTVHRDTEKVVRIVARFDAEGIKTRPDGQLTRIEPVQYYTRYVFFPAFDQSIMGMGFGSLIGPLNRVINTIVNQLLDAGTLANRQAGFLGKGIELGKPRMSNDQAAKALRFKTGEWKYVNSTGDDLRKNIFPLPVTPPSPVLFQLLGLMVDACKELGMADILTGDSPRQNQTATTTLALIEQGLKVFSAVYKRIHRSLKEEFKKLRRLNRLYLTDEQYQRVLDAPEGASVEDYRDEDLDIIPVSNTADLTDMQRIMKAEALKEMIGQGFNDQAILKNYLEALHIENIADILTPPEKGEDPKIALEQKKLELEERRVTVEEDKARQELLKIRADAIKSIAEAEAKEVGTQMQLYASQLNAMGSKIEFQGQILEQLQGLDSHAMEREAAAREAALQGGLNVGADQQGGVPGMAPPSGNAGLYGATQGEEEPPGEING